LARPDRSRLARHNRSLTIRHPTFHIVTKDVGFPYPFATHPHLLITSKYSWSTDNHNEPVFRHVYSIGHAATRELLQRYRSEAHAEIRKRLGINLFYTDALRDTVTVVTKKVKRHQGE